MDYSHSQWIMFFFGYSVLGWIWEVIYEGVKSRRFINRGFLHGPYLPIYGSGAVIILHLTLPHYENKVAVFLIGAAAASALEFITGLLLDRFFRLRLWDYRREICNIGGYVCVKCSLVWGLFALFLVYQLHPALERLLRPFSPEVAGVIASVLTVIFTYDCADSVKNAHAVKSLLKDLNENTGVFNTLSLEINDLIAKIAEASDELKRNLDNVVMQQEQESPAKALQSKKAWLQAAIAGQRNETLRLVGYLEQKAKVCLDHLGKLKARQLISDKRYAAIAADISAFRRHLKAAEWNAAALTERDYKTAVKLIARNPGSFSRQFPKEFDTLRSLGKRQ